MPRQRPHTKPSSSPVRPSRRRRRGVLVVLVLLLAAVLLPVVFTRTPLLKAVLLPRLGDHLGAKVTASHLVIEPDAKIIATGVEVRLPGLVGPAGRLFTADRIEIASSWGELLTGSGTFREMVLIRPRLRVSRDTRSGSINLGELSLGELSVPTSSSRPRAAAPRIIVREGTIELGEHMGTTYDLLRTLRVEGSVQPTAATTGAGYVLAFTEGSVSDGQGRGLGLTGRVSPEGITLSLDGLEFGQWEPEHIPAQFREVFALMRIEGGIPRASMSVDADGRARALVELDGVSLNLPFDAEGHQADPANLVRLRDVTGRVEMTDAGAQAFLEGTLGDLPSTVWLRYDGLGADAPFRCEIETRGFQLKQDSEILPWVPRIVIERLNDFSNPTATIDASVVIEREPPSDAEPGAIRVFGELALRDGTASFQEFPYTFRELTGLARFDEDKIEIVGISGVAQSGARMHATGIIAPLTSAAAVDLRIAVDDVPIDEALFEALGPQRREIIEAIISRKKYQKLLDRGLLRVPGTDGPGVPFALGGVGSVVIDVQRALGEETRYTEQVRVRVPEAGLLHDWFPLPIVARGVELLVADNEVNILAGTFEGAAGGRVEVELFVDLTKPGESGVQLTIRAEEVPTDDLLLAALPGGLDPQPAEHAEGSLGIHSPSVVLDRLGIEGTIECVVVIGARENSELGYDIDVLFEGLSALPKHGEGLAATAVMLDAVKGQLRVSERALVLDVASQVRAASKGQASGTPAPPEEDGQATGTLSVHATMGLDTDEQPFTAEVVAEVPEMGWALEDLLSLVAPELAGRLTEIRRERRPTGGVRLLARAAGNASGGGELSTLDIEVLGCEGLAFDTESGRLTVTSETGTLAFSALSPEAVEFDAWAATVQLDASPGCGVVLSGRSPFGRPWEAGDVLSLGLRGARVESPLIWAAAERTLPPKLLAAMEAAAVEGVFDADLVLRGQRRAAHPRVIGEIRPIRCELTIAGQRVTMDSVRGRIVLDETGGTFDACRAQGEGWWAEIGGTWVETGSGSVLLECTLDGASEFGLVPEVLALVPTGLRGALEAISIGATGPVSVEGMAFRTSLDAGAEHDGGVAYTASGRVVFAGASADFGVKVAEASGYLDFAGQSEPGGAIGNFGIGVVIDSAKAAGIQVHDGMLRVTSDPLSGAVLVPVILADAYGGRVSGSAIIHAPAGAAGQSVYDAEFRLSGVPLGELLADWAYLAELEEAAADGELERPRAESRGLVDAGLSLTGVVGDEGNRRGRGRILVGGDSRAEVLSLPLLLPLIKVSNLQVPVHDPLDFGEAVFYLDGDRVVFERVGVFARSVEIFGYGEMRLPGLDLDLRFTSRAAERLPVVSRLVEKFRDELVTTRVRGTVGNPEVSLEQFAKTRRLLARVVGQELSEQERRMAEIERLSRESGRREWRVPRRGGASTTQGR